MDNRDLFLNLMVLEANKVMKNNQFLYNVFVCIDDINEEVETVNIDDIEKNKWHTVKQQLKNQITVKFMFDETEGLEKCVKIASFDDYLKTIIIQDLFYRIDTVFDKKSIELYWRKWKLEKELNNKDAVVVKRQKI